MSNIHIIKGRQRRAQRVVLYGQEGVGKSTLVSRLPGVLVLDTEGGTAHLEVDRVPVTCLAQLEGVLGELVRGAQSGALGYRTVAIDTVDRVWGMCADWVCESQQLKSIEQLPYGKGLKQATERFCGLVESLDMLVCNGVHVWLLCHAKVERMSPPDLPEYTMYMPKVSAPGKQAEEAGAYIRQWADAVLFAAYQTRINATTGKAAGAERVLRAQHNACWEAKNRHGLPESMGLDEVERLVEALYGSPAGQVAAESPQRVNNVDGLDVAAEDELLLRWLRGTGRLAEGAELDGKLAEALAVPERRANALAQARAWEGGAV